MPPPRWPRASFRAETGCLPLRRAASTQPYLPAPPSGTLQVAAVARVDAHAVSLVDEERHVDGKAGLERRRLGRRVGGVALEPGVGLGDLELDRGGQLHAEDASLVLEQKQR